MKTAVIIFNLGGPDSEKAIEPFLFNLFNDPNIIDLPWFVRAPLAKMISMTRVAKVKPVYAEMGGRSPIQENTLTQANALQARLGDTIRVFTAQRYWHPFADQAVKEAKAWGAEQVVLLPLYPQFSTTTTGSFMRVWKQAVRKHKFNVPTHTACCYPTLDGFVSAQAQLIAPFLAEAQKHGHPRLLFSAHGLPEKIVNDRGDPYPEHVQASAAAIAAQLSGDFEWLVSYQSKVGPLEWVKPYTSDEIERAGKEKVPLVIVPLAFVSEHLETLVELDVEYRHVADEAGVPHYGRVPTVSIHPDFIGALADLVTSALNSGEFITPRICRRQCAGCAQNT